MSLRRELLEESITKQVSEINPIVAIPYASSVYSISLTKGPTWLFTGGEDGLIRKFDFFESVQGKNLLTVSQRHQLIDSILFNGVICSYWENEVPFYKSNLNQVLSNATPSSGKKKASSSATSTSAPGSASNASSNPPDGTLFEPQLSPVFSLAVENNGNWLLSGLQNGSITLQSIKTNEGSIQWYFKNANDKNIQDKHLHHTNTVSSIALNSNETNFLSGSWDQKILRWDLNNGQNMNAFNKSTGQITSLQYRPIIGTDFNWQSIDDTEDDDIDSLFGDEDDDDDHKDKEKDKNKDKDKDDADKQKGISRDNDESPSGNRDIVKLQRESLQTGTYEGLKSSDDIFLSSSIDGNINIWDSRMAANSNMVVKIPVSKNTPPWCLSATWSVDGDSVFIGRRNSTIEEYDLRYPTKIEKLMKFPNASGSISCIRTLPNKNYILCGCQDNIRLYDLRDYQDATSSKKSKIPFTIVPGHNGGILSDMYVDPTCRFMVSASGNRGWQGKAADYVFIYEFVT